MDCFATRDRSWGPRPQGRPPKRDRPPAGGEVLSGVGGIGYSFGTASPTSSFLVYSLPGPVEDPVVCGYLLRDGEYAHITGGRRRMQVDPHTGWPTRLEIEAIDDGGRSLVVVGEAVSRHWRGLGGDSLVRWELDGGEAWGEDQTYLSKAAWLARRQTSAPT